ncbi:MAG: GNAT family N-acetyltransferase [Nocardioides sp.]
MTTADVSVRVAWADDAAEIARVQVACWAHAYADLDPLLALDAEQTAAAWHASLIKAGDARNRVLVALIRNRIVGFAVTTPAADPDCDPIADGELSEWCVDPSERRQGHGSRLLQAAIDTLSADRFGRAVTWLLTEDEPRMRFLAEAGWAADGGYRQVVVSEATTLKQVRWHTDIGP